MDFDPVSVIEAAYRVGVSDEAWMRGILSQVGPAWDEGFGLSMFEVALDEQGRPCFGVSVFDSPIADSYEAIVLRMNREIDDQQIEHSYRKQMILGTLSERMAPVCADFRQDPVYRELAHPVGVYDFLGLRIADPSGTMLIMGAPLEAVSTTTDAQRRLWGRIAAHIAAGYRLRRQLAGDGLVADEAAAVLSEQGQVEHLADEHVSTEQSSRDRLELAAEAIGRARSTTRRDAPVEAIELWQALVDGRYSLVEHVDTDGKKMWLAHRNEPATDEPPELTPTERQVVQFAAMEHSNELIAYELGLPEARVAENLACGLGKLGLDSRIQLAQLWRGLQRS